MGQMKRTYHDEILASEIDASDVVAAERAETEVPDVCMFRGTDGALVVQIDTENMPPAQALRVNVNDGPVYQGRPEYDESPLAQTQSVADIIARWAAGHLDPSSAMTAINRVVTS